MNKMIKLPLFLSIVCLVATGLLATANAITAPIISQNAIDKQNAGYLTMLNLSSSTGKTLTPETLSESLTTKGLTGKMVVTNNSDSSVYGIVYDGTVTGFKGDIVFQIGFVGGLYSGFNCIASEETPSIGQAKVLNQLNDYLVGLSASDDFAAQSAFVTMTAGATYTKTNLVIAIQTAATDYLASV
ncbi:MAG: hypothetical protein NTV44_04830 [Firmicutes bacterium]|nr:hypothetical protein [Bacillota bacterium]